MIIDRLENADVYSGMGERVSLALQYLKNTDLAQLETGKYEIDGEKVFVFIQEYETRKKEQGLLEAHRNYLDIQYVIKGTERIGYTDIKNLKTTVEYDASKDILFGEGEADFLKVEEGAFMVLFPEDAHMPSVNYENGCHVKKAVVKIQL